MSSLTRIGFLLFVAGIAISIVGVLLAIFESSTSATNVSTGFCVVLFFVPLCFGSGPAGGVLLILSLLVALLIVTSILLLVVLSRGRAPAQPPSLPS
ncbi:hypothetical protein [Thermogladius sp.]|uniref:hypothetical protein n=1 Tax=Thermogladius sp. TaxID=2023064 RepID=UPI003D0FC318